MGRNEETRRKIQLGGLVVKAGIDDLDSDLLFGALLQVKKSLEGPKSEELTELFKKMGAEAFAK